MKDEGGRMKDDGGRMNEISSTGTLSPFLSNADWFVHARASFILHPSSFILSPSILSRCVTD
jgi:hypothetical protein